MIRGQGKGPVSPPLFFIFSLSPDRQSPFFGRPFHSVGRSRIFLATAKKDMLYLKVRYPT